MHTVGWAEATKYYLTNPISGAWAGSYFVNTEKWNAVPDHLKALYRCAIDSSHYYRLHWYWAGEARYRNERQARADDDPRRGVEDGRGRGGTSSGTRSRRRARGTQRSSRSSRSTTTIW